MHNPTHPSTLIADAQSRHVRHNADDSWSFDCRAHFLLTGTLPQLIAWLLERSGIYYATVQYLDQPDPRAYYFGRDTPTVPPSLRLLQTDHRTWEIICFDLPTARVTTEGLIQFLTDLLPADFGGRAE